MTSKTLSEKEDQENLKQDVHKLRFWKEIQMDENKRLDELHNGFISKYIEENGTISTEEMNLILKYTNYLKSRN